MNKQRPPMRPTVFSDVKATMPNQKRPKQELPLLSLLKRLKMSKKTTKLLAGLAAVILLGLFVQNYISTRNELKKVTDPAAAVAAEANKLAEKVGKYLELPSGETPTVATVKNVEQLNNQTFFERAKNGDKILVFPQARRAVLYRPSTNKVIEYAPIETGAAQ